MSEYDELGSDRFLRKYGYKPARSYFLEEGGRRYDSKAIAGVAVGKQHPDRGPLKSDEFSGGFNTVREKLQQLGFNVVNTDLSNPPTAIAKADLETIAKARASNVRYRDLTEDQISAYVRVDAALRNLGTLVLEELGTSEEYYRAMTSGYHVQSGVRGSQPKDLWFGVYARVNDAAFAGNPQLFAIASGRGLEYGFGASTHPSDFSNQDIKQRVREIAPKLFDLLPQPGSSEAAELSQKLEASGGWKFRRKARLDAGGTDFASLDDWLQFMHSPQGKREAGGGIYRYVNLNEIDGADLPNDLSEAARIFKPLMEKIRPGEQANLSEVDQLDELPAFGSLLRDALEKFAAARTGPMGRSQPLWDAMDRIARKLRAMPAVARREHIRVKWSLGQGVWAKVPWIALMDERHTTSTQSGTYAVFLVSEDLHRVYLNLAQGVTEYLNRYTATQAAQELEDRAAELRSQVEELADSGFTLDNKTDLGSEGTLAKNYERGTIAHRKFELEHIPSDAEVNELLEALLTAYDHILLDLIRTPISLDDVTPTTADPYGIEEALDGLFAERDLIEKILAVWTTKKNIVLQGAPGVGKSFVARRLAYALMGVKDSARVETVQFHQSYGYEDFVQGYRPTDDGGFVVRNGVFYRFCEKAAQHPAEKYVFVIDEINRGNLSKIFGELMLLIEPDKRSSIWATRLAYSKADEPPFHVPGNVHIIGMMNTADRSLSVVDYALRRRFAFFDIEPGFEHPTFGACLSAKGVPSHIIDRIRGRMGELNAAIAADKVNLGPGFRVGHSFFVPNEQVTDAELWLARVFETEIQPLLKEYWFDDPAKADSWYEQLVQ
jgi:hypothetical protein